MSLSDVFRDRHYDPGYVYIAGSMSARLLKIGTKRKDIWDEDRYLRNKKYGGIRDWVVLYHVWLDEYAGKIEHDARRRLRQYRVLRLYEKDGSSQRARELVRCPFSIALKALFECISDRERSTGWKLIDCSGFEFGSNIAKENKTKEYEQLVAEKGLFNLYRRSDELELSIRTTNCLKNDCIVYVGDLVQKTEYELLRASHYGRKSLNEIKEILILLGLTLGTEIPDWPLTRIEEIAGSLVKKIDKLEFSVRTANCLLNDNIVYVGELVQLSEAEMLRTPNFGRKCVNEIKEALVQRGLRLGMKIPGWQITRCDPSS